MVKYLAKVKDIFQLTDSFIVITDITDDRDYRNGVHIELRRPDGSVITAKSTVVLMDPPPQGDCPDKDRPLCISLPTLRKEDVPIGTEIWLLSSDEAVVT